MKKSFKLVVQYATQGIDLPTRAQFRRWVRAALEQEAEIVIRIVDIDEGYALNYQYRNKDYATNVLTFVYDDTIPLSGDIVLCAAVIKNEAQQQHKSLEAHFAHLTLHGVLHLQGYDHIHEDDAIVMEKKEVEILTRLGYESPYPEFRETAAQ